MSFPVEYMTLEEYACKCCGALPPDLYSAGDIALPYRILFDNWEIVRGVYGRPISINSAHRCPKWNEAVGGEQGSVHMFGLALDLGGDARELFEIANRECPDLRIGSYDNFIHIDVGYLIHPRLTPKWRRGARW
jgi:hypothetical protein